MTKIGIVVGEASGDLLGSRLIKALKKYRPDLEFVGIAGPKMQAEGAISLFQHEKLSLHGYGADVLGAVPELLGIRKKLIQNFLQDPPKVFIGIDAPDFNFELEKKLKNRGIPTIHYVSPSIWAWRKGRLKKIKEAVTHILTLFPFEQAIYEKNQMKATYVGHPMADEISAKTSIKKARAELKISERLVFSLLPGSRLGEVKKLSALMIKTAQLIAETHPEAIFLVPLTSRENWNHFETELYRIVDFDAPNPPKFKLLFGHSLMAMQASDAVLVASGTATLEAALLKRPMVITYRVSPWTWPILKYLRYQPWVGLPNILAQRFVVPECLQKDANPKNLAQTLLELLSNEEALEDIHQTFTSIHEQLKQGNEEKAAQAILPYL
jgi:lipid-A-disaccharide synthase